MALAKYFAKDLLAINRLIKTNHSILVNKLNDSLVTIAFDENCIETYEGNCGLELIIRLISRLYPRIRIIDLSGKFTDKLIEYQTLATSINSQIEIIQNNYDEKEDVLIVAGYTQKKLSGSSLKMYFGSDNWVARFSLTKVQEFGQSKNPIGSGLSACLLASNLFRHIFKDYLVFSDLDTSFRLSAFNLNTQTGDKQNPSFDEVKLEDVTLVGIGAVGNGAVWTLSKIQNLRGDLFLIDDEEVRLSNLQRYILLDESDEKKVKVEIAKTFLNHTGLRVVPVKGNWDKYIGKVRDSKVNCVAVGIDNSKDRIGIQSSLPKVIFNAFTETESLAITRHTNFQNQACLACSYIPLKKRKDYIDEVAENCNIPEHKEIIKRYYNSNLSVGTNLELLNNKNLLSLIAESNNIPVKSLSQFKQMTISQFYSDFVCGGIILEISNNENEIENVDAPLAFQSAMAGILLAAELVKYSMNSKLKQEQRTDVYHLSPIINKQNPYHRIIIKDETKRCICNDLDFKNQYNKKWEDVLDK